MNDPGFIDTHIHFNLINEDFTEIDRIIAEALENNVKKMVAIGGEPSANVFALKLSQTYPNIIYPVIGYNRNFSANDVDLLSLKEQLRTKSNIIAIGEIGLDYYRLDQPKNLQRKLFEKMLSVALENQRAVVVHSRQAREDTIVMIREYRRAGGRGGVLHCFTEDISFAEELIDAGFMVSFSGIATFKNASEIRNVIAALPLNKILIETDSPYLTPEPFRGKNNKPAMVKYVAETIAKIKNITQAELNAILSQNFTRVFL